MDPWIEAFASRKVIGVEGDVDYRRIVDLFFFFSRGVESRVDVGCWMVDIDLRNRRSMSFFRLFFFFFLRRMESL